MKLWSNGIVGVLTLVVPSWVCATTIYWTSEGGPSKPAPSTLRVVGPEGGVGEVLFDGEYFFGIDVDLANGKIYWSDVGNATIYEGNLDGTGDVAILTADAFVVEIHLDLQAGKIYWSTDENLKIRRANLDGTDIEDVIAPPDLYGRNFELDLVNDKIYYTSRDPSLILRADLDGTNIAILLANLEGRPFSIEVNTNGGKIYWLEIDPDGIWRANLDGTDVELLIDSLAGPHGLVVDVPSQKLYFAAGAGLGRIYRCDLNGENIVDLGIETFYPQQLFVAALGPIPAISTWGLIAMGLLLLTAGTIVYARRHPVAA